jgi:hypothetical protein
VTPTLAPPVKQSNKVFSEPKQLFNVDLSIEVELIDSLQRGKATKGVLTTLLSSNYILTFLSSTLENLERLSLTFFTASSLKIRDFKVSIDLFSLQKVLNSSSAPTNLVRT